MDREINKVVVHCSATHEGSDIGAKEIKQWHLKRGFNDIGYHFIIRLDGLIEVGRDLSIAGAHVKGHNKDSVGVCYVGGLDQNGKPKDTRTSRQKKSLDTLLITLKLMFSKADILGHRDLSPDLDGDGVVESHEWLKACPCYNVKDDLYWL